MRRSWIEHCLNSLRASTVPVTAIVIDNGSTDGTRKYVPQHYPDAVWLPQDRNLGFGQANNIGLRYALEHNADYVLLLNQDATIGKDAIERMLNCSDGNIILSPLHLNGDGRRLDGQFRICVSRSEDALLDDLLVSKALRNTYLGPDRESGCVIPAACWFIPISIIKKIGGFNPLFFHYGEDGNYALRLFYHHIDFKICPAATMRHDRGEHGNMQIFNKGFMRRQMLTVATDINLSFLSRLPVYLRTLKMNNFHVLDWLSAILWILAHYHQVTTSRRKEKALGATWL